jgi:hypothetical protein
MSPDVERGGEPESKAVENPRHEQSSLSRKWLRVTAMICSDPVAERCNRIGSSRAACGNKRGGCGDHE